MNPRETFVIVGTGLAGAKAAEALRTEAFEGRIVLIGEETERPYDRPALSKDFLQGSSEKEKLFVHPKEWYADHDVELRLGSRVSSIDRATHRVMIEGGEYVGYDRLLMTTGSTPRRLSVPGSDLEGVMYLREVQDSEAIRSAFATAKRVAIIGAGWIGLETAAAARAAGVEVTLIETATLPLLNVLGSEVAGIYASLHHDHGVELRMSTQVAGITGRGKRASGVRLADGSRMHADVVIVGIGITPNVELAEAAGLMVDNGIVVDEYLVTSDHDIFAAGDVANAFYPSLDRHLRLEHWSAALEQGPVAATNMMGPETAYDRVPYFFSDQYNMSMEYRGYVEPGGYDHVVFRGDVAGREFVAFWTLRERVLAGMNVNVWDAGDAISALISSGSQISLSLLADPDVPLEELYPDVPVGAAG